MFVQNVHDRSCNGELFILKKAGFPSYRLFCCCWTEILLYIDRYYNERIVH